MGADWVTWGLQFLIVALLARVWHQIDRNTDSVNKLSVHIPETYATRQSVHDIAEDVQRHESQIAVLRAQSR